MSSEPVTPKVVIDSELTERIVQGFGPQTGSERAQIAQGNDAGVWEDRDEGLRDAVIATDRGQKSGDLLDAREMLLEDFDRRPEVVRALLHEPEVFAALLDGFLSGKHNPSTDTQRWRVLAFWYELLWEYLHTGGNKARAHRHLVPLAARTRFLVLSEPFRHPDHDFWLQDRRIEDRGIVLGHDTWAELLRRVEESRDLWKSHLARYQSIPLFDHSPPSALEEELRTLAFRDATFGGPPLALTNLDEAGGEDFRALPSSDRAVVEEVVERHLLPRFAAGSVWAAVVGWKREPFFPRPFSLFVSIGVCWSVTVLLVVLSLTQDEGKVVFSIALGTAALTYLLIGIGAMVYGRFWTMPLMLRLPAAAAVGLIVLVAMHPDWWKGIALNRQLVWLFLLLVGVSFGYLLIEARNHNSGQIEDDRKKRWADVRRMLQRAGAITVTGLAHAFLVALLGMAVVAPAFSEDGKLLAAVWQGSEGAIEEAGPDDTAASDSDAQADPSDEGRPPSPTAILLAATAWCLAAGVFSQILWDDQPITAPLSHRRWRNER